MLEPFRNQDNPGLYAERPTIASGGSAASPQVTTHTLVREGVYLYTVAAKLNGSLDHAMVGTFLVVYNDASNDILSTTQIGTTAKASGSGFGLNTLTVSNPTAAGTVTITATWTDGANHSVAWDVTARALHLF